MRAKLTTLEASRIDSEKDVTASKDEAMRIQRVADNDVRSLKEEIAGLKQKFKQDKQAYQEKIKGVFKGQLETLMAESERYNK